MRVRILSRWYRRVMSSMIDESIDRVYLQRCPCAEMRWEVDSARSGSAAGVARVLITALGCARLEDYTAPIQ